MPGIDPKKLAVQLVEMQRIEARLNERINDPAFRSEFFADPVTVLKREGFAVPKDKQEALTEFFRNLKVPADAPLRLASDMMRPEIGIGIGIGIRF